MTDTPKNPPIETYRDGALSAKIWRNINGQGQPYYNVTFQRTYTDQKTGQPAETRNFTQNDLLKMTRLADTAYRTIQDEKSRDQRETKQHSLQHPQPMQSDQPSILDQHKQAMQHSNAPQPTAPHDKSPQRNDR